MPTPADHDDREAALNAALDADARVMPAFRPSGMLGEVGSGMDLAKSDNLSEGQHSGIIQDTEDWTVQWLVIVLAYLVFFPVAYVLLWRSQQIDLRAKVLVSVAGVAGIALAVYLLSVK